jgi:hypothetical protein
VALPVPPSGKALVEVLARLSVVPWAAEPARLSPPRKKERPARCLVAPRGVRRVPQLAVSVAPHWVLAPVVH